MIFGIIIGFTVLAIIADFIGSCRSGYGNAGPGLIVALIIELALAGIFLGCFDWAQVGHQEELKRIAHCQTLAVERLKDLEQVKAELAKSPAHDNEVYSYLKQSRGGATIQVAPQLRSNDSYMMAAKKIQEYNDAIYNLKVKTENEKTAIRVNNRIGRIWVPFVIRG